MRMAIVVQVAALDPGATTRCAGLVLVQHLVAPLAQQLAEVVGRQRLAIYRDAGLKVLIVLPARHPRRHRGRPGLARGGDGGNARPSRTRRHLAQVAQPILQPHGHVIAQAIDEDRADPLRRRVAAALNAGSAPRRRESSLCLDQLLEPLRRRLKPWHIQRSQRNAHGIGICLGGDGCQRLQGRLVDFPSHFFVLACQFRQRGTTRRFGRQRRKRGQVLQRSGQSGTAHPRPQPGAAATMFLLDFAYRHARLLR